MNLPNVDSQTPAQDYPPEWRDFLAWIKELLGCDAVRLSVFHSPPLLFVIIGHNRSTKEDERDYGTVWYTDKGNRVDFDYLVENVVASGSSMKELKISVETYHRLSLMTTEDYLTETGWPPSPSPRNAS